MNRPDPHTDTPNVLIVDDEPGILVAINRVLKAEKFRTHLAESAAEAREILARVDVQVVLSDVNMPRETGIQLFAWLREAYPRVQRILFTGGIREGDLEKAINEARMHRFLRKPFSNPELVETIRQSIEQWRVQNDRDRLLDETMQQREALLELNENLERKVAERTARAEQASSEWRVLFDSIADPLVVLDEQFRVRRANKAAARAAHNDVRNLLTRKCHEALFGRSSPCEGCAMLEPGEDGKSEVVDGRSGRRFEMKTWPFREAGAGEGENLSVCHYRDVTRSRELQRQVVMLEKLAAIGDLAGRVAHELNNPLTGILTFSQIMQRSRGGDVSGLAADIEVAARRCSNIVRSLLDFARGGHKPSEAMPVDVDELLRTCLHLARMQQPEGDDLRLELQCEPGLPPVLGQVDSLKSLFLNLVTNGVQAMGGQGLLTVRATHLAEEGMVQVQVRDRGPGIPEEIMDRIFEPFFTTKAENRQGTGLGLSIASNAVREHGGRIDVQNEPDGGACFTVELPVHGR